jgi:DNA-binding IclR family transcriptional regulator
MSDSTLQTADRALLILEMLAEKNMTATDVQNALALNKSTVHRLMMTLLGRGFVERNEATGQYQIGLKLIAISSIRLNSIELKTEAAPYMQQLARKLGKVVRLAILDDGEAVYIEKAESIQTLRSYANIGRRCPIYCSAIGKSLMMAMSDQEIVTTLNKVKMEKFTKNTHETPEAVLEEVKDSRPRGYTFDKEEHELGSVCIAAPIRDYRNDIVAAISISGYEEAVLMSDIERIQKELLLTADHISKRLGYNAST